MRWSAMVLSLVLPGMGHTAIGRPARGIAVTLLFTVGVVLAVARAAMVEAPWLDSAFVALLVGALLVYFVCQLAMARLLIRAAVAAARPAKEDHFRAGMAAAAQGDTALAERELRRVLSIDPSDVEAHLNLGTLFAGQGDVVRARRHLKRCRRFDIDGKWDWEVQQELVGLAAGTRAKGAQEKSPG